MFRLIFAALLGLSPLSVAADGTAGDFDYYVLSLSWSPNWCDREGFAQGSSQCDDDADYGWVLHGLWPQYDRGWPSYCRTTQTPPRRSETSAMVDIMGSSGLAWHQWRKHGVCSGMSATDYFALSRLAYDRVTRPEVFRTLDRAVTLPARLVQEAFLRDNPSLTANGITITCQSGHIQEARICLTRDLEYRTCGADVIRDCTLQSAKFLPIP